MSRYNGRPISDEAHLIQSISDIITTPLGSRVAVRDYGCRLHELIDRPVNRQWILDSFVAIGVALQRWEPRYTLNTIQLDLTNLSDGVVVLKLAGLYKPTGRVVVLDNVSLDFGKAA